VQAAAPGTLKGKRDRKILKVLPGCGLRRCELADLGFTRLQLCEEHWAIVDLVGKAGHIRTVSMRDWSKSTDAERGTGKLVRPAERGSTGVIALASELSATFGGTISILSKSLATIYFAEKSHCRHLNCSRPVRRRLTVRGAFL